MTVSTPQIPAKNRILHALSRDVIGRLSHDLTLRPLLVKQVVQRRARPVEAVIFPISGVGSMVSTGNSGDSIEVATIGYEGIIGLPLFLGGTSATIEIFVQVPGEGLHMPSDAFQRHIAREESLVRALLRYTQALIIQIAQCAACNAHHTMVGRCARWLLQTHDRAKADSFLLTHEFLGRMLGVRRASVSEAAQALQDLKLIHYSRGTVTVLDRDGLEKAACECYRLIANEYDTLFPATRPQ